MPNNPDETLNLSNDNPLHKAVGKSIEEYTQVEATLASILQSLLSLDL
jgi:hypothetical protein